jgi:ketosteroid isomerase-like protein
MVTEKELNNWLDACNSHDVNRILKLLTSDAVVHEPQNVIPLKNYKLRQFFNRLFHTYPCFQFKNEGFVIQGNEVASWKTVIKTMINPSYDQLTEI